MEWKDSKRDENIVRRAEVHRLIVQHPEEALNLARSIRDSWYRCQALSRCALQLDDAGARIAVLEESFETALRSSTEPNRVVSLSSWPLKAMATLGEHDKAAEHCERLLRIIGTEPSPVRRADALELLLGASALGHRVVFDRVLAQFIEACLSPLSGGKRNRRGQSQLYGALRIIAFVDAELLHDVVDFIDGPELTVRARKWVDENWGTEINTNSLPPYLA
jgi:hypothetical protein